MDNSYIKHQLEHYFAVNPSPEMKEIFWSTAIRSIAISVVGVFEPIYLYTLGLSIPLIIVFYMAQYAGYFFLLPFGGRLCRRYGYEKTILLSSPMLILFYLSLFLTAYHYMFLVVAVLAIVGYKVFYSTAYHGNFAHSIKQNESGREVSNIFSLTIIITTLAPVLGGALIFWFGFGTMFMVVCFLILLANIPLLRTPEQFIKQDFPYYSALKSWAKTVGKSRFWAFFGFGEHFLAVVIWPIFILTVMPSVLSIGILMSLSKLVNVIVTLYVGRLTDEDKKDSILHSGTVFTTASWVLRPFITGPLGIFLIDSYYRVSRNIITVPFFSMMYQKANNQNDIMKEVVINEMSVALGKFSAGLIAVIVFLLVPNQPYIAIFIIASLFTMLYSFLPRAKNYFIQGSNSV